MTSLLMSSKLVKIISLEGNKIRQPNLDNEYDVTKMTHLELRL